MRGVAFLYTLLACSVAIFGDVNVCSDKENEALLRHEDCNKFYKCTGGQAVEYRCNGDLLFNSETLQCESPQNVNCDGRSIPTDDSRAPKLRAARSVQQKTRKPGFLPNGCPETHIHWLLPHETNCSLFYYCVWGNLVLRECSAGTHFNRFIQVCDWPQNANCSTSTPSTIAPTTSQSTTLEPTTPQPTTPEPTTLEPTTAEQTTPEPTTSEASSAGPTTSEPITPEITTLAPSTPEPPTTEPTTSATTKPEFLPNGCPVNPHIHWLLPHETDCTLFYYCVWGELVLRQCAPGTHFNSILQVCDWPQNANCLTSTPSTIAPTTSQSTTLEPTTPQPTTPELTTLEPTTAEQTTPEPTTSEASSAGPTTSEPITPEITTLAPTTPEPPITEPTTSATTKPEFLPNGCPVNPHIHWLLPHETDCTLFYYCVWGELVLRQCAPGTHFNSILQVCDWPQNANCLTSTPSTIAPTTSQSTTLEPTTPQPTTPEPTTLEPTTAEQTTPEPTTSEASSAGPTTSEPITPEITTLAPTTPEPPTTEPTTSATTKPEFLPNGCPVNPHIHWLLPHETDCTLFYYCVWGELVLRQCAPGTHFNSILQVCDWPQNANCLTSTPSTIAPTTSQSTTLEPTTPQPTTPEPTTLEPTTAEQTTPEPTTSEASSAGPTTSEPITPEITTLAPTTPEPPTTEPTTSATTKPEFLPNGCPVNPHIHWLLPHETDCTLFYYCVWGELVLRQCAPGTHFNSILQVCDWPQNANCSTSTPSTIAPTTSQSTTLEPTTPQPTTPEPTTLEPTTAEQTTPEPTTSEASSAGPTTSEPITPEITTLAPSTPEPPTTEPTTSATTKPEFLPNGCPVNPHIHWLLPHETDCTLFYYCVWGELVLRQCAPGTHFNSILQVCDWPQNANCSTSTPTTPQPTTLQPTTLEPTTPQPTTLEPTTAEQTTLEPTTSEASSAGSTTSEPITPEITTLAPTTPEPPTTEPTTSATTKPEFLPNGCPVNPHIHWLLPHETDCTLFYYCVWGELVLRQCAPGTHFNTVLQICDWPQNANCTTSSPSTPKPTTSQPITPGPTTQGSTTASEADSTGPTTSESISPEITAPPSTTPEQTTPGLTTSVPITTEIITQEPTTTELLPNGCPANPHIHCLLPHETDCTLFYQCVWGHLVLMHCGPGTYFNRTLQVCDWPHNAGCTAALNNHLDERIALLSL
ncbi:mucin-2-like [Aricia agestis]|uniref:mucin-2-like n=1 Tax=Aricia agestis TaxID=91739 RepID=UPI001C206427|nr:mucin-2-like [Aricia agestis]